MFDIDSGKLLIVAVLALIVIGPKELPRVLRQVGQAIGKMRRMATEFQGQFMDAMKEADIADIRKELAELNGTAALSYNFDPARDIQSELTKTVDSAFSPPVVPPPAVIETGAIDPAPSLASPTEGFSLPALPAIEGESLLAEVIAPAIPGLDVVEMEHRPTPIATIKRKILVKKRRSTFNIVRNDEAAWASGHPFGVRERAVRPKSLAQSDATAP